MYNMRINKNKSVGRVLFIVESARTEFTLLRRIFCYVLGYEYMEKRRILRYNITKLLKILKKKQ